MKYPSLKLTEENIKYIYDKLEMYGYKMIMSKPAFISSGKNKYVVLNYNGKFGYVSCVSEKSAQETNRIIVNSYGDFMKLAYHLIKPEKITNNKYNNTNKFDVNDFESFIACRN